MAEFFTEQKEVIINISKCLKLNQVLIIKEHPLQPGKLLSREYRNLKKRVSNLVFLPAEIPIMDVIKKSKIVITISSSVGWESILAEVPTVVMGKVFYDKYPLVNNFENYEKLKKDIKNNTLKKPKKEITIEFLGWFLENCYEGNPYLHANLYEPENLSKLIFALEDYIFEK
jgi:capsule polysaccharide modification protein KpsS